MKDDPSHKEDSPLPASAAGEALQGTVSHWRSFLWENMPTESLRDPKQGAVLEFYQQNGWQPYFISSRFELTQGARELVQRLGTLDGDAIDPKPYHLEALQEKVLNLDQRRLALKAVDPNFKDSRANLGETTASDDLSPAPSGDASQKVRPQADPAQSKDREHKYREAFRVASELDIRLTQCLIRLAKELSPLSWETQIKGLTGQVSMVQFLKELEPAAPHYQALYRAYGKYKALAAQGGQVMLREKGSIRLGETGNHVRNLQKRLQQEDLYEGKITGNFDSATQQAVQQFQRHHLIDPDGSVGQRTMDWLNIPFARKAAMVAQSMKGLRQSNTRLHDRYVRINIPQFMLEYYKDGKVQGTHKVIVGKAAGKKIKLQGRMIGENNTPTLSSFIENVIFNPRWYVSDRIRQELSAAIASDPAYFAKHGYVQMNAMYPWGDRRLFQLPGPKNPLGRVKFEFANAYAVFLHDTPQKPLFNRSRRDFSHGCVRVEGALRLAQMILKDDQNPAAEKTESYLGVNDRQTYIKLQQPVPIILEYIPVVSNGNGDLVFCGDLYGWIGQI